MQRSSPRGWPAPSSYPLPLCGHKSVTNWPVKPGLQLWCVIMVAKSSRAVLVNQAVRVGGLAGSSALFASCTAPDKALQPPGGMHLCPYSRCFLLIPYVPAHGREGRYGQTSSPRSCCALVRAAAGGGVAPPAGGNHPLGDASRQI